MSAQLRLPVELDERSNSLGVDEDEGVDLERKRGQRTRRSATRGRKRDELRNPASFEEI